MSVFWTHISKCLPMDPLNKELFLEILAKYNRGNATEEEIEYLEAYYNLFEVNRSDESLERVEGFQQTIKARIETRLHERPRDFKLTLRRYAAAAVILLSLTATIYFTLYRHENLPVDPIEVADHAPGGTKATLRLGNGEVIILDAAVQGKVAEQAGTRISNTAEGILIYVAQNNSADAAKANMPNTITTPKGGQYQLVLADGTKVWLNSASSITFPAAFDSKVRQVELVGEAYFEVARNKNVPFHVKTANQLVEVLGTHFNINAYEDEGATTTTLLEGSVRLSAGAGKKVLKPGEQASVTTGRTDILLETATNVEKIVAWKNGVFAFDNEDLETIMRQISRRYDVDVVYATPLPKEKFFGEIPRNSKLSEVCKILELNNLSFEISGRSLKVSSRP